MLHSAFNCKTSLTCSRVLGWFETNFRVGRVEVEEGEGARAQVWARAGARAGCTVSALCPSVEPAQDVPVTGFSVPTVQCQCRSRPQCNCTSIKSIAFGKTSQLVHIGATGNQKVAIQASTLFCRQSSEKAKDKLNGAVAPRP